MEIKIDFTDLRPEATRDDIYKLCDTAVKQGYYSVCVSPMYAKFTIDYIETEGYNLKVVTVIGYPSGAINTHIKLLEAEKVLMDGVNEIDIVMPIGAFKEKRYEYVKRELSVIVDVCKNYHRVSKIIIETGLLTEFEIVAAAHLVKELGADFIKTCTSSVYGAVHMDDIRTIKMAEPDLAIKASGGIKTIEQLKELEEIGVERVGTSSVIS